MAIIGTVTKQPREIYSCEIDYASSLDAGDYVSGFNLIDVSPTGASQVTVAGQIIPSGGLKSQFNITGGADATTYTITIVVNTFKGLVFEDEISVIVEDVT